MQSWLYHRHLVTCNRIAIRLTQIPQQIFCFCCVDIFLGKKEKVYLKVSTFYLQTCFIVNLWWFNLSLITQQTMFVGFICNNICFFLKNLFDHYSYNLKNMLKNTIQIDFINWIQLIKSQILQDVYGFFLHFQIYSHTSINMHYAWLEGILICPHNLKLFLYLK